MRRLELAGVRSGRLVAVEPGPSKRGQTHWWCLCDCGSRHLVRGSRLVRGETISCGCAVTARMTAWNKAHRVVLALVTCQHCGGQGHRRNQCPSTLDARFDEKWMPEPNSGCWIWLGASGVDGYGHFYGTGRFVRAHRFSYERARGPIPTGLVLDHLCRTTCCVNPEHLEAVPQAVNVRRYFAARG